MKVTTHNQQRDLPVATDAVEQLVSFLLRSLKVSCDEVIIHLVTERKISKLHQDYFNDPTPTDCISFPIDSPEERKSSYSVLGEVFVCPKIAIHYAKEHNLDRYEETTRYIVHGILHLLGYDDICPDERSKMRAKENKCVRLLAKNGLLLQTD